MGQIYKIQLSSKQRKEFINKTRKGKCSAGEFKRMQVLLQSDNGRKDIEIAQSLGMHRQSIRNIRKRFCERGHVKQQKGAGSPKRIDGKQEAYLIALACSNPPSGQVRWTLRLLSRKAVELHLLPSISHNAVGNILRKNEIKPWLKKKMGHTKKTQCRICV